MSHVTIPFDRPYMISYLSSSETMSLSYTVSEVLSLISQNQKTSTQGTVCNPSAKKTLANQCTKFQVSSFSHSGDI